MTSPYVVHEREATPYERSIGRHDRWFIVQDARTGQAVPFGHFNNRWAAEKHIEALNNLATARRNTQEESQ